MEISKFGRDSMFQRIKASYLNDEVQLTPGDILKRERLEKIYSMRCNGKYSRFQTLQKIMSDFTTEDGKPVSRATAYRDYAWSMAIFGDVDQLDKAVEKMILAERYLDIATRARKKRNLEAEIKALNSYEKVLELDKNQSMADLLKFKSVDITLRISPKQKKAVDRFFQLGVADFNDFDAEDIEYDEVNDEEDEDDERE